MPEILDLTQAERVLATLRRYEQPSPLLIIISGPSGVGKDSVIQALADRGHPFEFVVTTTNRKMREGEVDGADYIFVSTAEFERMIAADELFEWAPVYDHLKGVPKTNARKALASGKDAVMRLDVQGVATIKEKVPDAVSIFIAPPSLDALIGRLQRRNTDTPEQLAHRVRVAVSEIEQIDAFDYVVVNRENELAAAATEVLTIISAEKHRAIPRQIAF